MSLNTKNNPVGIDKSIQKLQTSIYNYLGISDTEHNSYGRIYSHGKEPFAYIGNGEYKEVKLDDKFSLTSIFVVDSEIDKEAEIDNYQANVSFITFSILSELEPLITHRADEEFVRDVVLWLEKGLYRTQLLGFVKGLDAINGIFNTENIELGNTQPYHITRYKLLLNYNYSNC